MTWHEYREGLEDRLENLLGRIHRGAYQPIPSKRVYIEKADGRERPLGLAVLEDKIVQGAVVEVLNAIYEEDMMGFSYGFRKGRSQHQALDALNYSFVTKNVNWVLDADIRGFFDAIDHDMLYEVLERRIGDQRVLRLIRRWLRAGVIDGDQLLETPEGTPQGAVISPLLANVFLHYVFDTWAHDWRKRKARGDVTIVRYADDFVVGFQFRRDAEEFLDALRARLGAHSLELHPEKTRLIEFGKRALRDRRDRGEGKPETFDFLGFTHICAYNKRGRFFIRRNTIRKRLIRKLKEIYQELRRRRHDSIAKTGAWLRLVIRGHLQYYAVPTNRRTLWSFSSGVARAWYAVLRRRGDKRPMTWKRFKPILRRWFPKIRVLHEWPITRMARRLGRV